MKKFIILLCTFLFVSVILCGCGDEKVEAAAEKVGDKVETIASEVKDNVDDMIEDGTVRDGDGYIGEHNNASEPSEVASEESHTELSEDQTEEEGIFQSDLLDMDDEETGDNI